MILVDESGEYGVGVMMDAPSVLIKIICSAIENRKFICVADCRSYWGCEFLFSLIIIVCCRELWKA